MLPTCLLPFSIVEKVFYVLGILIKFENWSLKKKNKTHSNEVKHLLKMIVLVPKVFNFVVFLRALTCLLLAAFFHSLKASLHARRQL